MILDITAVNLSAIDLNLLLVLHTVLEERSVTRAAHRLHLTQPAVSNALARLRATLGDRLVIRSGGTLQPTPRALAMLPHLTAGLAALTAFVEAPRFDAATSDRTFTLADSEELSELPRLAGAFARRLPHAMLRLVTVDDLAVALADGTVDAALGPATLAGPGLVRRKLYDDRAVLVVRRGHPHTRSPKQLARLPQIVVQSGRSARRELRRVSNTRVAMVMPDYMSAALAVSVCDYVTSLPRRFAHSIRRLLPLHVIEARSSAIPIALYWHERTHDDAGAALFRALVTDAVVGATPAGARADARAAERDR